MSHERLVNLIGAAAVAVKDLMDAAIEDVTGLKGEGPAAVLTIGTRRGRPIDHLRRSLGLSHSGTVRLVDRLEERGWVRRKARGGGREVLLGLTVEGNRTFRRLLAARRAALEGALDSVPSRDRPALERALSALLEGMPDDREDAWHICRLCDHSACRDDGCPVGSAVDHTVA